LSKKCVLYSTFFVKIQYLKKTDFVLIRFDPETAHSQRRRRMNFVLHAKDTMNEKKKKYRGEGVLSYVRE